MTAKVAHRIACPEYVCNLSDEEIMDRIDVRIMKNANNGMRYAAFPEAWFRPDIKEDLEARGFLIHGTVYKSKFKNETPQDYRRIGW